MFWRALSVCILAAALTDAQQAGPGAEALQQRIAAVKQSIARNQARLKQYEWTETTEVRVKGELKKREQSEYRYGPDGKVMKTPIGAPAGPEGGSKGLRGKLAGKKVEEMKDYMDRAGSLLRRYVPPNPQMMQAALQAGKAAANVEGGTLEFRDYAKPGDNLSLEFDTAARRIRSYNVTTYLDAPNDVVNLNAHFSTLPDGTNFLDESVLDATAKQIQIKTANFGHRKVQ